MFCNKNKEEEIQMSISRGMDKCIMVQWCIRMICSIYREWGSLYRLFMWQKLMIHGSVKVCYRGYLYTHTYTYLYMYGYYHFNIFIWLYTFICIKTSLKIQMQKLVIELVICGGGSGKGWETQFSHYNYCIIWIFYSMQVGDL